MFKSIVAISFLAVFAKAAFVTPDGVCQLNLPAYTGGWYQLATSPYVMNTTEMDCICPAAYYTLNATNSDNLDLTNSCINGTSMQFTSVTGNVYPAALNQPAGMLNVVINNNQMSPDGNQQASMSDSSNYIIMRLWRDNEDMRYALVGGDNENTWYLLSRSPNWNNTVWTQAQNLLQSYEYNTTHWVKNDQSCIFLGTHGNNLLPPIHE